MLWIHYQCCKCFIRATVDWRLMLPFKGRASSCQLKSSIAFVSTWLAVNHTHDAPAYSASLFHPPGGSNVLEVVGLPANLRQTELPSQLCDLTKLGARLHIVASDEGAAGDSQGAAECTVIAIFDSDVSAQQALAMHKGSRYRLKPASRCYDIARLERPISWQYLFL